MKTLKNIVLGTALAMGIGACAHTPKCTTVQDNKRCTIESTTDNQFAKGSEAKVEYFEGKSYKMPVICGSSIRIGLEEAETPMWPYGCAVVVQYPDCSFMSYEDTLCDGSVDQVWGGRWNVKDRAFMQVRKDNETFFKEKVDVWFDKYKAKFKGKL